MRATARSIRTLASAAALLLALCSGVHAQTADDTLPATDFSAEPGLRAADVERYTAAPGFAHAQIPQNTQHPDASPIGADSRPCM